MNFGGKQHQISSGDNYNKFTHSIPYDASFSKKYGAFSKKSGVHKWKFGFGFCNFSNFLHHLRPLLGKLCLLFNFSIRPCSQ